MNSSSSRINFLVQASEAVAENNQNVSQFYGRVITTVAEKSSTKLDFTIKRRMCKKCRITLMPGINCTYRIRRKKTKGGCPTQVLTCMVCSHSQRLILKRGYKLKSQTLGQIS